MPLLSDLMDPRGEARFSDQVVAPRSAPAVRSVPAAARGFTPVAAPAPSAPSLAGVMGFGGGYDEPVARPAPVRISAPAPSRGLPSIVPHTLQSSSLDWRHYFPGTGISNKGMDPVFSRSMADMIRGAPARAIAGMRPTSAYRSPATQAVLFDRAVKKYGSPAAARKWVAPPGRSMHGFGKAYDIWGDQAAYDYMHEAAPKYDIHFPMSWEPWHAEPLGTRGTVATNYADTTTAPTMSTRGVPETPTLASVMTSPRPPARQEDLLDPYIDQMMGDNAWKPMKALIHTNVDAGTREQAKRDAARAFLETGGDKDAAIAAMSEKYTPMAEAMQIPLKRRILEAAFPGPKVLAREQSERMAQPSGVPLPPFPLPTAATRGQPEIVNPYAVGGGLDATTAYTNPYAVGGGLAATMGADYPLPGAPRMPRDAIVPPATVATPVTTMGRIETAVNNLPILKGMRAADAALMAAYDKYAPDWMKEGELIEYPEGWGDNGDVVTGDAGAGDWRRKWIEMFGPDSPILDLIGQQYPDISKLNAAEFEEFNKYWLSLGDG